MKYSVEIERNLVQIYESTYRELFDAATPQEKEDILSGKAFPDVPNEVADVFVLRVIEKAETAYDKLFVSGVIK